MKVGHDLPADYFALSAAEAAVEKLQNAALTPANSVEERLAVLETAFEAQALVMQALAEAIKSVLLGCAA